MCRPHGERYRRCTEPSHQRHLRYLAAKTRASEDPALHREALESEEPLLVMAGASRAQGEGLDAVILEAQLGLAEDACSDDSEARLKVAFNSDAGTRTLRRLAGDLDRLVRFAAIAALHEREALTDQDWGRLEVSADRAYLLQALRDPLAAASRAAFDEAEREREEAQVVDWAEVEATQIAEWSEHRAWQAEHLSGRSDGEYACEMARDRALARGLAANPNSSDSVVRVLAADEDGEVSRRAVLQLEVRNLASLWRRHWRRERH